MTVRRSLAWPAPVWPYPDYADELSQHLTHTLIYCCSLDETHSTELVGPQDDTDPIVGIFEIKEINTEYTDSEVWCQTCNRRLDIPNWMEWG